MQEIEALTHEDDFAKIVRTRSGRQVLIRKGQDSESDHPALFMHTYMNSACVTFNISFSDDATGYELLDTAFASYGQREAENFESMVFGAILAKQ